MMKVLMASLGCPLSSIEASEVTSNKTAIENLDKIIDLNIKKRYYEEKRLRDYIDRIEDSRLRLTFKLRFIDCLSWNKVADELGGNNTEDSARKSVTRYIKKHPR